MHRVMMISTIGFLLVSGQPVLAADDPQALCEVFSAENDIPTEPCACIAEALSADEALLTEQASITSLDDFEMASDEFKAAVNSCTE